MVNWFSGPRFETVRTRLVIGTPGEVVIMSRRTKAFTLIELLVVIAIIALLVSILIPSLRQAKELAHRVACAANLRSMHQALTLYGEDFDGMPGRAYRTPWDRKVFRSPKRQHGGVVSLGLLHPTYYGGPRSGYWCPAVSQIYQRQPISYWVDHWTNGAKGEPTEDGTLNEVDIPYMYRRTADLLTFMDSGEMSENLWRVGRAEYLVVTDTYYADFDQRPNHNGGHNNLYWGGYVLWYDDPNNFWWRSLHFFEHDDFYAEMDSYGGLSTNRWK